MLTDLPANKSIVSKNIQNGPVYAVGEAARLVGVSPSTIRLYEREGLLSLGRSVGGHRYLSTGDIGTLKRIGTLRRTQGLALAEIRRQLQREAPSDEEAPPAEPFGARPGPRLRALRQQQGKTLRELSQRTGLSSSFLSAFERGTTGISVANLQKLIGACGTSLIDVFAQTRRQDRKLVRAGERPRLEVADGAVLIEDLAGVPRQMEVQLWTIQPGAGSEGGYSHAGEEAMFLVAGTLTVALGETQEYRLEAGDCLYFASSEIHRWQNTGDSPVVLLWVNTPPTF